MGGIIAKEKAAPLKEEGKMLHLRVKKDEALQLRMQKKGSDYCPMLDVKEEPGDVEVPFMAADYVEVKMKNHNELPGASQEVLLHDVTSQTDRNLQDAGGSKNRKKRASELFDDLYEHYLNRTNVKVVRRGEKQLLVCCLCGKEFKTMPAISKHLFRHPMPQPTFTCQVCDKEFRSKGELQTHFRSHDLTHRCSMCTKKFSSKKLLLKHRDNHFEEYESTQQVSDDETMLEPEQVADDEDNNRHERTEQQGNHFGCRRCECRFAETSAWTDHIKNHALNDGMQLCLYRTKTCEEKKPEELGSEDAAEAHRRKRTRRDYKFECKRCDRRFSEKSVWISHIKSHALNKDNQLSVRESEEGPTEEVTGLYYDCFSCERRISENMWRIHLKSHALIDKVCVSLSRVIVP